jgi:hypothetical protein
MGMANPFMPGGGFGMPPNPYGAPAAPIPTPSANNPFADTPFVGQRMENDPLNELTRELLGAKPDK